MAKRPNETKVTTGKPNSLAKFCKKNARKSRTMRKIFERGHMAGDLERQRYFKTRRQDRHWLEYQMINPICKKIPWNVKQQLLRLMKSQSEAELRASLGDDALEARTRELWARLLRERAVALEEQGQPSLTDDWWIRERAAGTGQEKQELGSLGALPIRSKERKEDEMEGVERVEQDRCGGDGEDWEGMEDAEQAEGEEDVEVGGVGLEDPIPVSSKGVGLGDEEQL
ncbi:MAG: hypothetical protein Q9164_000605 [Protoblastenia rupestris]